MIRWLVSKRLDAAERQLGESVDYLRHIFSVAPAAFWKFAKIMPLASHRSKAARGPIAIARVVAAKSEDCGPCVQTAVNLARRQGVPSDVLRAAVDGRVDDLPADEADAYRFAEAVAARTGEEAAARERLRARFGDEAVAEMALAVAIARVFPTVKRGLGYATSCARVEVRT